MGNGICSISNLKKTYYYLRKNGLKNAYYAALERIMREKDGDRRYTFACPLEETLQRQRQESRRFPYTFSILVPAYETDPVYLREMIDSVLGQSYEKLELILADAGQTDGVNTVVRSYADPRIRYVKLKENKGISDNTNAALAQAQGDYIGLLDHDDVLTPDALYAMAKAIEENERNGNTAWMLYSDEDKGNGELTEYYEPHFKPDLNVDLLLSNNYICHFLVMKKDLMKELGFRREYDGAQDYDLVLRAVGRLLYGQEKQSPVIHIPSVLYHWRCHSGSTAENPESKRYAYEAGRRALEDFLKARGWRGTVADSLHLGFYMIHYEPDILSVRSEVGAVCGRILDGKGRLAGGFYQADGSFPYMGISRRFSGYMHRAALAQEVSAPDLRTVRVRKELQPLFEEVFGFPYRETETNGKKKKADLRRFDWEYSPAQTEDREKQKQRCLEFGRRVRQAGYLVVWQPEENVWM